MSLQSNRHAFLVLCLLFTVAGCGSSTQTPTAPPAPDPVQELEKIATQAKRAYKKYPGKNGSWSEWAVKDLSYDVRKTDSLVKPYEGEILLSFVVQFNDPQRRAKTILECGYRIGLEWKDNKWQPSDHQIAQQRQVTISDEGLPSEYRSSSSPMKPLSSFTDFFSQANFGTDLRVRMAELVGLLP